ncbi:hypothetical protein MTP99_018182 [Tenebrio molitor]|nr:hypothetical protein MTP99_018182 [Tenebrio molitor]
MLQSTSFRINRSGLAKSMIHRTPSTPAFDSYTNRRKVLLQRGSRQRIICILLESFCLPDRSEEKGDAINSEVYFCRKAKKIFPDQLESMNPGRDSWQSLCLPQS